MSAEAMAAMAAPSQQSQAVAMHERQEPQIEVTSGSGAAAAADNAKPTGLHSPPDSNNAMKLDGSDDSELSDLDENDDVLDFLPSMAPVPVAGERTTKRDDAPKEDTTAEAATGEEAAKPEEEEEEIGEILPDHYSGTVPVFKPTMFQFKDFKKFVRHDT